MNDESLWSDKELLADSRVCPRCFCTRQEHPSGVWFCDTKECREKGKAVALEKHKIEVSVEIDPGVYWPEWVTKDCQWSDNLGRAIRFFEKAGSQVPGMTVITVSSDESE